LPLRPLQLFALKSRLIKPKDQLLPILKQTLKKAKKSFKNNDILVIASKVIAVSQNRISKLPKIKIAKKEADIWLSGKPYPFSIKNGILIPCSGVDASNSRAGELILWPEKSWEFAKELRVEICREFKLKNFGIIISDSTCRPLRWGVTGIALAWAGFFGVQDERGKKDLFGKKLQVTQRALADSLAAASGVISGEAGEKIPFVLIRNTKVKFSAQTKKPRQIQPQECLFSPIYTKKLQKIKIQNTE
jgi:F420-0:gamma-glutamyl ligase